MLLVDDDSAIVQTVSALLAGEYDVVGVASDSSRAVEMAGDIQPDAIVLDINMPDADGFHTLQALEQAGSRAPVVFDHVLSGRRCVPSLTSLAALANGCGHSMHLHGNVKSLLDNLAALVDLALARGDATCIISTMDVNEGPRQPLSRPRMGGRDAQPLSCHRRG